MKHIASIKLDCIIKKNCDSIFSLSFVLLFFQFLITFVFPRKAVKFYYITDCDCQPQMKTFRAFLYFLFFKFSLLCLPTHPPPASNVSSLQLCNPDFRQPTIIQREREREKEHFCNKFIYIFSLHFVYVLT